MKNYVKKFSHFVNESEGSDSNLMEKLDGIEYLHSSGSIDTDEYVRSATDILKRLGRIPVDVDPEVDVYDQNAAENSIAYWKEWADRWRGPADEELVSIVGEIDSKGRYEFKIVLNTGIRVNLVCSEERAWVFEVELTIDTGKGIFTEKIPNLLELEEEWSGPEEQIGIFLGWTLNKYGHLAIESKVESVLGKK